jgi:hypothetical protein
MENKLISVAKERKTSKSEIVKEALNGFLCLKEEQSSYQIGKDYFGRHSSGRRNLSTTYKKSLKEKINAKYRSR